jgi:hypothetical protein
LPSRKPGDTKHFGLQEYSKASKYLEDIIARLQSRIVPYKNSLVTNSA